MKNYELFKDKVLLVTGGTGSFGMAVTQRFLNTEIKEIRIFSRDEKKQDDMRKAFKNEKLKFFLGDVKDPATLKDVMYGVDYVFHAAALKQVPSCEFFPLEAVKTNVFGTENVLNAAVDANVKKVICLSTDKAAYPINAMGISKAMMEKVFVAKAKRVSSKTIICGTRYGNVMASRGSVIPLFVDQIKKRHPLTITDLKMTRFMMSLEEAVELVLYAFEHGNPGDLFVQKAPACTIEDLAMALKNIFKSDSPIKQIGIRHGEKMYESLMTNEEGLSAIENEGYFKIPADQRDLNYDKYFVEGVQELKITHEFNSNNTAQMTVPEIEKALLKLEYIQNELKGY